MAHKTFADKTFEVKVSTGHHPIPRVWSLKLVLPTPEFGPETEPAVWFKPISHDGCQATHCRNFDLAAVTRPMIVTLHPTAKLVVTVSHKPVQIDSIANSILRRINFTGVDARPTFLTANSCLGLCRVVRQ